MTYVPVPNGDVNTNVNTGDNELLVNLKGHECSQNSTNTPLGIDGVFTGSRQWHYSSFVGCVKNGRHNGIWYAVQ